MEKEIIPISLSQRRSVALVEIRRQRIWNVFLAVRAEELAMQMQPMELIQHIAAIYQALMETETVDVKKDETKKV